MNGVQKAEVRKMVQEALKELTEGNDMVDNPTKEEIKDMADRAEDSYAEYAKEPNEETIEAMEEVRDGKCLRHAPAYSVEEFKPSFVNTEIKVGLKKLDKMVIVDFLEIDDYFARLVTDNGGFVSSNGFELKIESDKHYETQLEAHRVITSCISKKREQHGLILMKIEMNGVNDSSMPSKNSQNIGTAKITIYIRLGVEG